jgi:hypothetical protein
VIVAFDFFTVPKVTFNPLHRFFVIEHGRRKVLHLNATCHPMAGWAVQQLGAPSREAGPCRYAIFDYVIVPNEQHVRRCSGFRQALPAGSHSWLTRIGRAEAPSNRGEAVAPCAGDLKPAPGPTFIIVAPGGRRPFLAMLSRPPAQFDIE